MNELMHTEFALGADIGGSHITAALVDLSNRTIIPGSLQRKAIDSKGTANQIIKDWSEVLVKSFASKPGVIKKIGLAMPGPCDYENGTSFIKGLDKYEALYGLNIIGLLATELQIDRSDIVMKNDATCFLRGEVFSGAAKEGDNVVGVTLGTGLGSAYSENGIVYDGDLWCTAYKDGTAEDYISARWLVNRYNKFSEDKVQNVKELKERVITDAKVKEVFAEFGTNLGEVLASFSKRHKADTVVIGGNINNAWDLFMQDTQKVLLTNGIDISIKKAVLGEAAALIGAASCWNIIPAPNDRAQLFSKTA